MSVYCKCGGIVVYTYKNGVVKRAKCTKCNRKLPFQLKAESPIHAENLLEIFYNSDKNLSKKDLLKGGY